MKIIGPITLPMTANALHFSVAHNANGTYGRFRYVKELRGYVVVPHADSSVYFYRSTT